MQLTAAHPDLAIEYVMVGTRILGMFGKVPSSRVGEAVTVKVSNCGLLALRTGVLFLGETS